MNILVKESLKGTIMNYLGAFIGFLSTTFIIIALLPPEIIGLSRVLVEGATLMAVFMQMGITSSAIKFFPYFKSEDGRNNGFFFYLMTVPAIGSLIIIPMFYLFSPYIIEYFSQNSTLFAEHYQWLIPLSLALTYIGVFEVYANVLMRITIPKLIREIVIRLLHITTYVCYATKLVDLNGFLALYVGVFVIAAFINLFYVSRIGSLSLKHQTSSLPKSVKKDFLKYTLILMIGLIGSSITPKLDLFMVSGELGFDYGGIYTLAFYMVAILEIPSRSISAIASPVAASAMQSGDIDQANRLYQKISLNQLLIGGFIFVILWANIDNVYQVIPNGEIYVQGKYVILFLGLAKLCTLFVGFGHALISYSKYYPWTFTFSFVVTAITILSNALLIPVLGMSGAAVATLISTVTSLSFQQFIVFRKIKCNPYTKGTLKVIAILAAGMLIDMILPAFSNPWIDAVLRTSLLTGVMLPAIYISKISLEINSIFDNFLNYCLSLLRKK